MNDTHCSDENKSIGIFQMKNAGVAQLVEQLICNQQVGGSSPSTSSTFIREIFRVNMGEFPSGQRGQTVNLLLLASMVRIHLLPPETPSSLIATRAYLIVKSE